MSAESLSFAYFLDNANVMDETNLGHETEENVDLDSSENEKEEYETEEEKIEKEFRNEVHMILQKLKSLPSEATELKMPPVSKDVSEIYSKLCKALRVPENATLLQNSESEKLDFSYQCLGPVGITPVVKALTFSKTLKVIDLKYNNLGAESLPAITLLLERNDNITHLNLQSNNIGKGSALKLSELISHCNSLEYLDLSKNNLGDEELQEIGIALMKIDSVKDLVLSTNDFSSEKSQVFGSSINKCSALQKLDLSCCHFEDGTKNIFAALRTSNLTVLNLARNGIPDDAAPSIANGFRAMKSLQELDISYNFISNKGAKILAPGLKRSSTLTVMNLAHNPIQGSAAALLLKFVGGNLKVLDLSGIKVNLAFFKILKSHAKSGREIKVLFGSEIRYDIFPRGYKLPAEEDSLTKSNALRYLEKLADDKGVSLRNVMKSIHATFLEEQHAASAEVPPQGKDDKKGKKDAKPQPKVEKTGPKDEKKPAKDEKEQAEDKTLLEMKTGDFAKRLTSSQLGVPKGMAAELAELFSEDGIVDMWKLISSIQWKPDDLYVAIKGVKKVEPAKKEAKGKKKK